MTRLILPIEQGSIVSQMIQNIELQRAAPMIEPASIQVFELPPKLNIILHPDKPVESVSDSSVSADSEVDSDRDTENERKDHMIDWWAEAQKLSQEADDDLLQRWLIEQGYVRYASVMQGPLPKTNSVRGSSFPTDDDGKTEKNSYGELETRITDNCVMQMPLTAHDISDNFSDFSRNLPARIVCKSLPKKELSFQRQEPE